MDNSPPLQEIMDRARFAEPVPSSSGERPTTEGTLGSPSALLFAGDRGRQSYRKVVRKRDRRRRVSRKQPRRVGS